MKVLSSLTFYYIPKFLKNDLIKRSEINIHPQLDGMFISKLYDREAVQLKRLLPSSSMNQAIRVGTYGAADVVD